MHAKVGKKTMCQLKLSIKQDWYYNTFLKDHSLYFITSTLFRVITNFITIYYLHICNKLLIIVSSAPFSLAFIKSPLADDLSYCANLNLPLSI